MNGQEHATRIEQFRNSVCQNFTKRVGMIMDLVDALCSQTQAKSVVKLSLESCYQRRYSTLFKALAKYQPKDGELAELAGPELPQPTERKYWLWGVE